MADSCSDQLLQGRRIVVAVTGGIAAYKACTLVSRLVQEGAEVRVAMTESARQFVGPIVFRALTNYPVSSSMWEDVPDAYEHISLARFAEVLVVVPATANTMAKVAAGLCDDLVSTTIVATTAPVVFAPAMNAEMWNNPITQANVARLREVGYHFVMPEEGHLGCGEVGPGRLADPETIRQHLIRLLGEQEDGPLRGKRVLITAGPTREWLDPVRFISNPSTGKMGLALAEAAAARGALVTLVLGPTELAPPAGVETVRVETAADMRQAVQERRAEMDLFIGAAAVSDWRPETQSAHKQKKGGEAPEIKLLPTADIIAEVAAGSPRPLVVVGFAAESQDLEAQARAKLERKGLDLIVANDITQPGAGFASDSNEVLIIDRNGRAEQLSRRPKREVARRVLERVEELMA
ncbi:MAG TPA: bifunctional phosphopantothenoylcysteine decarboxylase/phosphopantothenate--cysteine ligase CoaBC [Armatimonadota bacterium]|jgi:phosphopantothenoylcysteine decarboxylase/phosphopantothenate--cysteine ligase